MVGRGNHRRGWIAGLGLAVWAVLPAEAAVGRIALVVENPTNQRVSRIYTANPDGTGLQPLSPGQERDTAPAFSPDGRQIAYQVSTSLGLDQIMIQGVEAPKPRLLGIGAHPQWSRDGKRILFSRRRLNEYGIYVTAADGSGNEDALKPLTRGQIARWSPDEKRMALVVPIIDKGVDRWQLQVMQVGAAQPNFKHTLPESFGQVVSLEWSPAGDALLFTTSRQAATDLHLLSLDSPETRKVPLNVNGVNAGFGSWSPDGREILFRVGPETTGAGGSSKLCLMKSDGTDVRVIWDPASRGHEIRGTAWFAPAPAAVVAVAPAPPVVKPAAPPAPTPMPAVQPPPNVQPDPPAPVVPKVLAAPKKVHSAKLFKIARERSPVSVPLAQPGANDFLISVNALPWASWNNRRQGVGITLELEDGSLYRGNVIYSGGPWVTLQGRPKGAKVRLIDGKQLAAGSLSFRQGFKLTLRREGKNISLMVNDQEVLSRPIFTSGVKQVTLTLENFDPGVASFRLGGVYFQEVVPGESTGKVLGTEGGRAGE